MRHTRMMTLAATSAVLLLTACSPTNGGSAATTTGATSTSSVTSITVPTPAPAAGVTKPAKDHFTVCDTKNVAVDDNGLSYCTETKHETPEGATSVTCLADFAATAPTTANLQVTYSVFRQGRNVAYFRKIPAEKYAVKDFQVRYDFKPEDGKFWGDKTLPPGSYYCEWYTADETKLGEADIIHGQLPSSTVGTPGAAY